MDVLWELGIQAHGENRPESYRIVLCKCFTRCHEVKVETPGVAERDPSTRVKGTLSQSYTQKGPAGFGKHRFFGEGLLILLRFPSNNMVSQFPLNWPSSDTLTSDMV